MTNATETMVGEVAEIITVEISKTRIAAVSVDTTVIGTINRVEIAAKVIIIAIIIVKTMTYA